MGYLALADTACGGAEQLCCNPLTCAATGQTKQYTAMVHSAAETVACLFISRLSETKDIPWAYFDVSLQGVHFPLCSQCTCMSAQASWGTCRSELPACRIPCQILCLLQCCGTAQSPPNYHCSQPPYLQQQSVFSSQDAAYI